MKYDGIGLALQAGIGAGMEAGVERVTPAERLRQDAEGTEADAGAESFDTVTISARGRELAAEMSERPERGEEPDGDARDDKEPRDGDDAQKRGQELSGMRMGGEDDQSEKEEAVDELKDTQRDLKSKKQELEDAKRVFNGSEDEQEQKIKKLKQDISDLEDTRQELQSTLVS